VKPTPPSISTARLAVFSFLAPLFGVLFGVLLLGERLSASFAVAALLVGAGIGLVAGRAVTVGLGTQRFVVQVAPAAGRGAMVTFTRK